MQKSTYRFARSSSYKKHLTRVDKVKKTKMYKLYVTFVILKQH